MSLAQGERQRCGAALAYRRWFPLSSNVRHRIPPSLAPAHMKSIVAIVDWCGPYSVEEALPASFDYEDGLYVFIGKTSYERQTSVQYIGLASSLARRLNSPHHKLPAVTKDLELWLGDVASPRSPGRKIKVTDRMLDLVEWAHIYFLQLPLNDRKKSSPPDYPITVYNRWWRQDYETRYKKRPHADWPDLIDYLGAEYDVKLVWFGGKQVTFNISDV